LKFSYSWLKQLVDLNLPAHKLAEFLSMHAFETEVVSEDQTFDNIIVARVTKIDKHPNADRLRVIELTDGENTIGPVVCGAWNFDVGARVALALPGAVIPHDQHDPEGKSFKLSKATIRGIESQGMICSTKELGLGGDGSGILLLNSDYKVGEAFAQKSESSDTLFDISVPANRPDLISYRGVAWEIAALTGKKYLAQPIKPKVSKLPSKILKVRIAEPNLCKKYLAVRLTDIKVAPSPKFIQERLKASGLRPINNVVDIANYVMLEVGQPLHAFDAVKVIGAINVRKAYMQENLVTLDSEKRKLSPDMLVIADSKKVLAIAGVIGGADSAIDANTQEIILESANFNAVSIRRTARALGIRTDASSRFEKSLPPTFASLGLEYAAELLKKYANGKPVEFASTGAKEEKLKAIKADPEKINQLLGTNVPAAEQTKILAKLGFKSVHQSQFEVPFWRADVTVWQDLAEEIARFKGLEFIKPIKPSFPLSGSMTDPIVDAKNKVSDLLVGMGFDETHTYSFVSETFFKKHGLDTKNTVEVANPINSDLKYLRLGLGMNYEALSQQNSRYVDEQCVFEIGNVYSSHNDRIEEHTNLFLMCYSKNQEVVARLVGSIRELFKRLGIEASIRQTDEESGEVYANKEKLGHIRAANEDLKWAAVELNFEKLTKHIRYPQFQPLQSYPAKELDVALLVRQDLPWSEIKHAISHKLITDVKLFDVYAGKNISPGKKSLAFRIVYQAPDRTLTDEEVEKIHKQILDNLKSKFNAQIRD